MWEPYVNASIKYRPPVRLVQLNVKLGAGQWTHGVREPNCLVQARGSHLTARSRRALPELNAALLRGHGSSSDSLAQANGFMVFVNPIALCRRGGSHLRARSRRALRELNAVLLRGHGPSSDSLAQANGFMVLVNPIALCRRGGLT